MESTMYCRFCRVETREQRCPVCDRKKLWPILPEDPCFLTERMHPWCDILADVLTQEGIAFHRSSALGAGVTSRLGIIADMERFSVPYGQLQQARELEKALFSGEAELLEEE